MARIICKYFDNSNEGLIHCDEPFSVQFHPEARADNRYGVFI